MKKIMIATAVMAAAFGLKAEIASANVVGYTTRDINNKFKMSAAQFETIGNASISLNGAVGCAAPAAVQAWDDDYESYDEVEGWRDRAPQIQVPKVGEIGYNYYYYVSDARSSEDDSNAGAGWADVYGYLTTDLIPAGFGIWTRGYVNGENEVEDTIFTFNGQVNEDDSQTVQCENMFKLRALPYPKTASLNANVADWSALTPVQAWDDDYESYDEVEGWRDRAPQIQVPKVGEIGYNYYYYITDARSSEDDSNAGTGWADVYGYLTTDTIPVGYSIWINARTAESVDIPFNK